MALTVKPLEKVRETVPVENVGKPDPSEIVRVNALVTKEIRMRWHVAAMERDMSLTELIHKAVEHYIQ